MNKPVLKVTHASLHFLSMAAIIVAMVAAFSYHTAVASPHMYSLHSWIGMIAVVMFFLQVNYYSHALETHRLMWNLF